MELFKISKNGKNEGEKILKELKENYVDKLKPIELPYFKEFIPKGLEHQETEKLLEELYNSIGKEEISELSHNGMCLSGPHGVGKSAINYLFASVGFINSYFVLYILFQKV